MGKIKVLVISPQYTPDFGPSAPIYTALCEDLASLGFDVNVITAYPHYGGADNYFKHNKKLISEEEHNSVNVIRSYVFKFSKSSLWRRMLYHLSFNLFSAISALRVKKPDIVLADAPTLWSGLPLFVKSLIPGIPFIYIVHDIYPDILVHLGLVRNPKIIKFINQVERVFYNRAAQISVLSMGFKNNLVKKGVPEDKITIIPACVDTDFFHPLPRENKLRDQWNLGGKFVVLYAGNIGLSQGLETVINAAQILRDNKEIVFVIIGEGVSKPALESMVWEKNLSNVMFYPFQPREDVPLVYALADACLVSLKRDIVVESVPSKAYSIMACGRPMIAAVNQESETSSLINHAHCGLWVEPENSVDLSKIIATLYQDKNLRERMGKNGRKYILEHFSRSVATQQYQALICNSVTR